MYDIDQSPMNDLLELQTECYRITGHDSYESRKMEQAVEYWGEQDDDPPPIVGDCIADRVKNVLDYIQRRTGTSL